MWHIRDRRLLQLFGLLVDAEPTFDQSWLILGAGSSRLRPLREELERAGDQARRQVGNFPQAFSHIALIITALNLHDVGPA
jgi:hypothetical protein